MAEREELEGVLSEVLVLEAIRWVAAGCPPEQAARQMLIHETLEGRGITEDALEDLFERVGAEHAAELSKLPPAPEARFFSLNLTLRDGQLLLDVQFFGGRVPPLEHEKLKALSEQVSAAVVNILNQDNSTAQAKLLTLEGKFGQPLTEAINDATTEAPDVLNASIIDIDDLRSVGCADDDGDVN